MQIKKELYFLLYLLVNIYNQHNNIDIVSYFVIKKIIKKFIHKNILKIVYLMCAIDDIYLLFFCIKSITHVGMNINVDNVIVVIIKHMVKTIIFSYFIYIYVYILKKIIKNYTRFFKKKYR